MKNTADYAEIQKNDGGNGRNITGNIRGKTQAKRKE